MKGRSLLLAVVGVAALAAAGAWVFRPRPVPVELAKVERATFEQTVDEEGRTRVRDRYTITTPLAGRVERIALKAGDTLARGDLIAVLRPSLPALQDARTVAELRERLGAAEAGKLRADANVERQRAILEQARFDAERAAKLAAQGFASRSAADQSRLALAQQAQALQAAQYEQHAAGHELELARVALAQGGRAAAGGGAKIEIRAPSSGQLLKVIQESEAALPAGAPLVEIGDAGSLEAVIDVLSQDATRIAPGMRVRLVAAPGGAEMSARVRRVEPSARTKVSSLGVEEQRVSVVADFDAVPNGLGDGWRVDARVVVLARDAVPVVPIGALFRDRDGWAVWTVDAGRAARRAVQVGGRNQTGAWASGGIEPGEPVIVYPPDAVRDGIRVAAR